MISTFWNFENGSQHFVVSTLWTSTKKASTTLELSEVRPDEAGSLGSPKVVGLFPTKPSIHPYFIRH
jgi:hypothetical protein